MSDDGPPSPHIDSYARDGLPPREQWPVLNFDLPELQYPSGLNAAGVLLDSALADGHGDRVAVLHGDRTLTYADMAAMVARVEAGLADGHGVRPGDRVLLRGTNTPEFFAAWLAVVRMGAIAVPTMPLLRRTELAYILGKVRAWVAICEPGLEADLEAALAEAAPGGAMFDLVALAGGPDVALRPPVATRADDICLIAFTSGTTGQPKACLHFHRDILAMCDTFARHILRPGPDAIFTGTPPIAFTFGLGALLAFPMRFRAATALPQGAGADALAQAVSRHRATHIFTSPTGYRQLLKHVGDTDLSSLEASVSAGEHLNAPTWEAWHAATGLNMIEGIGATELIHIFASAAAEEARPGRIGKAVPGFTVALLDPDDRPIEGAGEGRLAVRGPTGCRYMGDPRQTKYVIDGWNVTGDLFRRDAQGWLSYAARADEMIVSAGYNISGAEIEAVLARHAAVAECAVVGVPDAGRGQIVKAVVVVNAGFDAGEALARVLQDYVKGAVAAYKYPRLVEFAASLPRTSNGKLMRHALRGGASG
jgi:2-aminobenzoate-CoA ligase